MGLGIITYVTLKAKVTLKLLKKWKIVNAKYSNIHNSQILVEEIVIPDKQ